MSTELCLSSIKRLTKFYKLCNKNVRYTCTTCTHCYYDNIVLKLIFIGQLNITCLFSKLNTSLLYEHIDHSYGCQIFSAQLFFFFCLQSKWPLKCISVSYTTNICCLYNIKVTETRLDFSMLFRKSFLCSQRKRPEGTKCFQTQVGIKTVTIQSSSSEVFLQSLLHTDQRL